MTIKELATLLSKQGHDIKLQKRADGGYRIVRIDNIAYKASSGNIAARKIAGVSLSHARSFQLARIRTPKGISSKARKKTPLPEELVKELKKVQRQWRKKHEDIGGTLSMRGLRYQYEKYGKEVAMASLDKSYRYAQGLAYIDNVNFLVERLENAKSKASIHGSASDISAIERTIERIKERMLSFKEDWIRPIYDALYDFEKGAYDGMELERIISSILV